MPVEDTDFSPSATAVMFLLTIHLTTLEKGDFLSTGVKVTDGADYASQDLSLIHISCLKARLYAMIGKVEIKITSQKYWD